MKLFEKTISLFIACCLYYTTSAQLTPFPPLPARIQALTDADTSGKIIINQIRMQGNKKTKNYIILREMRLKQGDSVNNSLLSELVEQSRSLIYNTTLFTSVDIIPFIDSPGISLDISVKEKWYLYPAPQFKLVDRNINEWLKRFNGDLNRVVYGVKFSQYNFSGRRDQLRFQFLTGYARNVSFSYSAPYSNSDLTEGYAFSTDYVQNREIGYEVNPLNQISNFKEDGFVRKSISANGSYIIRRGFYNRFIIGIGYAYMKVHDSVAIKTDATYFNSNKSSIGFPSISYSFQHVKADNISYPLKGNIYSFSFIKNGLGFTGGINLAELNGNVAKFISHGNDWYSSIQLIGKIKAPFNVAFINRRALGFGDFYLRGLENYVIDGVAAALAQYTLKKKIISFNIPVPFKIKALPKIPVALFAKTFVDAGTSYIPAQFNTRLNNRLLYTAGFGLDILTLYDINLRLEYSFNQLNQNGLFLHGNGGF